MQPALLTPAAAAVALLVAAPLAAFLLADRRRAAVRRVFGAATPDRRARIAVPVAFVLLAALCGLAAAQPVLDLPRGRSERTDAEAFVVIDVTRSMLASRGRGEDTRLDRAKAFARDLQRELPEIRLGLASLTDRTLPYLFPTTDHATFRSTLDRSVGIEQPPPSARYAVVATTLAALAGVVSYNFFSPEAKKRVLVVLTDAESMPVFPARLAARFRGPPPVETVLVHVWGRDERIYTAAATDPAYVPDPRSDETIESLAEATGGRLVGEDDVAGAADAVREVVGPEGTRRRLDDRRKVALAPYVLAAGLLPLGFILRRRNL